MLPAYAGMIRSTGTQHQDAVRAPRVCGDDPGKVMAIQRLRGVLPAYAGMIRRGIAGTGGGCRAPRVCGDDPREKKTQA